MFSNTSIFKIDVPTITSLKIIEGVIDRYRNHGCDNSIEMHRATINGDDCQNSHPVIVRNCPTARVFLKIVAVSPMYIHSFGVTSCLECFLLGLLT